MMLHAPWPLSVVTGFLGSGKTTLITRLLRNPVMADTVVIVNEFGEIGLDHHLIRQVTDQVMLLPNGCLCCTVRQDVIQTLRDLQRSWLAAEIPDFRRVLVETTGLAEPEPLVASLTTHPVLQEVFSLCNVLTVVDAEYGLEQLGRHTTCWQQACVADHLVISKCDLVGSDTISALRQHLRELNPLASLWHVPGEDVSEVLFARTAERPPRSPFACTPEQSHLAQINATVLKAEGPLSWRKFQVWLNTMLERLGPDLLRLKGCLLFDQAQKPVIIQAVQRTFYPLTEAPIHSDDGGGFLVLITAGKLPVDAGRGFEMCRAESRPVRATRGAADQAD